MVNIWCFHKGKRFETLKNPQDIDDLLASEEHLISLDVEDPSQEELDWIREEFNVHPIAMEDYNSPQERSRIDRYEAMYSIVVFALGFAKEESELTERPLTLFVGPRHLVTLHADPFPPIKEARA